MNQASIADIVDLAASFGMLDLVTLVDAVKLGSASSAALTLLNTMITPDTVDHLAAVEAEDMRIFDTAMTERGVNEDAVTARTLVGAHAQAWITATRRNRTNRVTIAHPGQPEDEARGMKSDPIRRDLAG